MVVRVVFHGSECVSSRSADELAPRLVPGSRRMTRASAAAAWRAMVGELVGLGGGGVVDDDDGSGRQCPLLLADLVVGVVDGGDGVGQLGVAGLWRCWRR